MKKHIAPRNKDAGLLLPLLSAFFAALSRAVHKSVLLGFFRNYDAVAEKFAQSAFITRIRNHVPFKKNILKFKLLCASYSQKSILLGFYENAANRFFHASFRSLGIFFLTYGGFIIFAGAANAPESIFTFNFPKIFLFGCLLVIISLFFLPIKGKSIAAGLKGSRILSYFFFDTLSVKHLNAAALEAPHAPTGFSLIPGLLCGLVSYLFSPALVLAIFLLIVFLYLVFTKPENGILLICFTLPFTEDTVILYMITVTLVSMAFKVMRGKRSMHLSPCTGGIILLGLLSFSGVLSTYDGKNALYNAVSIFMVLGFAFAVMMLINASVLVQKCFRVLCLSALVCALLGMQEYVLLYLANRDFSGVWRVILQNGMTSCFPSSELFAAFLIAMIPLCFVRGANDFSRFFSLFVGALLVVCLVLTGDRNALIALICSLIFITVLFYKRGIWLVGAMALALYVIKTDLPWIGAQSFARYLPLESGFTAKILSESYYNGISDYFRHFGFFGAGIGEEAIASASAVTGSNIAEYVGPGGTYFNLMMKIGIPLFLAAAALFLLLVLRIISYPFSRDHSDIAKSKCAALVASLTALMIYAFFTNLTGNLRIMVLIFLIPALGSAVANSAEIDYIPQGYDSAPFN